MWPSSGTGLPRASFCGYAVQIEKTFKIGIGSTPAAAVTEEKESERVRKGNLAKRRSLRPPIAEVDQP